VTPAPTSRIPTATPVPDKDTAVVDIINRERKVRGLAPLLTDPNLTAIARQHNGWMSDNNCFDHNCPGEETVWQRLARAGYPNYAGSEVILRGCDTADCALNGWRGSSEHWNILMGSYTHIGCAFDAFDGGYYMGMFWTCDLGRRSGVIPTPTPTRRADSAQPPGYYMLIEVPYDTSTQAQIDALYWSLCNARKPDGVRCVWHKYRTLEDTP
jgi:hypothetical protein